MAGDIVAIKVMEAVLDKEEDIKAELNVFQHHAHHPNIVNFFGAFIKKNEMTDDHIWIVMEVGTNSVFLSIYYSHYVDKVWLSLNC